MTATAAEICTALWERKPQIARELIDAPGAALNGRDELGFTPLLLSVLLGYHGIAETLLDKNADPDAATQRGETALYFAVAGENLVLIDILLDRHAEIDKPGNGMTPLMLAVRLGLPQAAALLLARGADPGIVDDGGRTIADYAKESPSAPIRAAFEAHARRRAKEDRVKDVHADEDTLRRLHKRGQGFNLL